MYIPDVCVFTPRPISVLTADTLRIGIERRLALLTYLFCPDEEVEPETVLEQLKIEDAENNALTIRWRPRMRYPPRAYRFGGELKEQLGMARFGLRSYPTESVSEAIRIIDTSVDGVGFFQGYTRNDMGWPVVMAAAAAIVDQVGGAIATGCGWFIPQGDEVRLLFNPDARQSA